jgi:hypothetical protein
MPISAAALRAMKAAGATAEMLIAAVEAQEAIDKAHTIEQAEIEREHLKKRRQLEAARQQRKRDRDRHAPSRDVTRDERDSSPSSFPPTPPHITTPSQVGGGDDGGGAGARDQISRRQAVALTEQTYEAFDIDQHFVPPKWMGLTHYLQGGLGRGWRPDLVLLAVQKVAAQFKRNGEVRPEWFGYLTKPIEREHQEAQRQFLLVIPNQDQSHVGSRSPNRRPHNPLRGGVAASCLDDLAEFARQGRVSGDQPGEEGAGDGGGGGAVRIISSR